MPASATPAVDDLLREAAEKTNRYEWMAAAALFRQALDMLDPDYDPLEASRIGESLAKSYFRGSFQSSSRKEFKERMQLTMSAHGETRALYEKAGSHALANRSKARSLFATFWLTDRPDERKKIIDECISTAEQAAQLFEKQGEKKGLAESQNDLTAYFAQAFFFTEGPRLAGLIEKATKHSKSATALFEDFGDEKNLAESLYMTVKLVITATDEAVTSSRYKGILEDLSKADIILERISRKLEDPYSAAMIRHALALISYQSDPMDALRQFDAARGEAEKTGDSHLIGSALTCFANAAIVVHGEAESIRDILEKAVGYGSASIQRLKVSESPALGLAYHNYAECLSSLSIYGETEADLKKTHLQRAVEIGRQARVYDYAWQYLVRHALSKALYFLATLESHKEKKRNLLLEALQIREEILKILGSFCPESWDAGISRNYSALIRAELSDITRDRDTKVKLLKEAVADMEICIERCAEWTLSGRYAVALSRYEEWYGDILVQSSRLTRDAGLPHRAIRAYENVIAFLAKSELFGQAAPLHWKIASTYDEVGEYAQALSSFRRAEDHYKKAAKNVSASAALFNEIARYMEAWSLIEEARIYHGDEEYDRAAENYANVANILRPTKGWGHLSEHYTACALLEKAEALSQQERMDESVKSFEATAEAFRQAEAKIEDQSKQATGPHEEREIAAWLDITRVRETYCHGRTKLEHAKVLDRQGQEEQSAAEYRSASEIFEELREKAIGEESQKELETLALFCDAWAKMKEAETSASPELYTQAGDSFVRVENTTKRKKPRFLALASASICKALRSGTLFRRTRNTELYSDIKKHLETAADYYQQAHSEKAAGWARATQRMFDALAYLADAEMARDSKEKTEFYHLAQKHLEFAAKLYGEAGFPSKKEEALTHLRSTKEEKEVLLTPLQALTDNPALTGSAVAPVSLVRDQPVGLERFEVANLVGNLSLHPKELGVGANLILELEMANVGKTGAALVKLENIAPEGFEIDRQNTPHRIEDNYLDMKGRRVEYLKTHEVRIMLKAARKGTFQFQPRILFVDERGSYRSYEFEPHTVTVSEIGISGWLRGPK